MNPLVELNDALSGRYRIDRELGRGGMATVYLAHDLRHDRKVAIKVFSPEFGVVLGAERFFAEIATTARLQHPHLLPLFDSGSAGGLLFYVMPFVDGESLRARLDRERQLPIEESIRLGRHTAVAARRHSMTEADTTASAPSLTTTTRYIDWIDWLDRYLGPAGDARRRGGGD